MIGKTRCRLHGGATPAGLGSATFKHGRYSKVLPMNLALHYDLTGTDPELLTHTPELRLLDTRLHSLVSELGKTDPHKALEKIISAWEAFQRSRTSGEMNPAVCLEAVGNAIKEVPIQQTYLWGDVLEVVESRGKILERETRRIRESEHTMEAPQLIMIIEFVADIVRQAVTHYVDRTIASRILTRVSGELSGLVNRQSSQAVGPETVSA
jgi:hypothetical protein